ncbi:monosaccharide ABC transporter membrane protein, CUT2 family [Leptolinea tardivitalis]|nr:monosaccharide ABC transporter membrane protein, CUT2 family [Leptolinea tardivitalis]
MITQMKKFIRQDTTLTVLLGLLIFLILLFGSILQDKFFSFDNIQSMGYQIPEFAFLALAMSIAMITGGIDLSVVANANMAGIMAGYVLTGAVFGLNSGMSDLTLVIIAILVALIVATLGGVFNGILIAKFSVPAILATLGTMTFYNGISTAITEGKGVVGFPDNYLSIGTSAPLGIPLVFYIFFIAFAVVAFVMVRTPFGQSIYLYGENRIASLFSGIKNEKMIIKTYALAGFLSGIAAIIMTSRVNSAKYNYGDSYLLQAILVAVLGGINPNGGRGKVTNVIIGILILQILQSAFTLFAFSPYAKRMIFGFMLLLIMVINFIIDKWGARSKSIAKDSEVVPQEAK